MNGDIGTVPTPFAPLADDARLEFELATTDPDGNPTNGITRTKTNKDSFDSDDFVKSSAGGGADPWPSDRYLNIWVCPRSGGLLGYAQFPGGPAATDGVVILHSAFGTTGTATAPFNLGRTTTHEVGHWLNLRHIWGDVGTGCFGSDFVADTPNQAGPNYGTPSFPRVTCGSAGRPRAWGSPCLTAAGSILPTSAPSGTGGCGRSGFTTTWWTRRRACSPGRNRTRPCSGCGTRSTASG